MGVLYIDAFLKPESYLQSVVSSFDEVQSVMRIMGGIWTLICPRQNPLFPYRMALQQCTLQHCKFQRLTTFLFSY